MNGTVSVIAPTMNEAGNIPLLVRRIIATSAVDEILFVDDSSTLETVDAIKTAQAAHGNSIKINYYHRVGADRHGQLFGAVIDGIERASGEIVVVMDADLQHPPETIPALLVEVRSHANALAIASRYMADGSNEGLDGTYRQLASWGANAAGKLLFPRALRHVADPMTGFFALRKSQFRADRLQPKGFKILLETIVRHPELTPVEVPLHFEERHAGESKASIGVGRKYIEQLIRLRLPNSNVMRKLSFAFVGGSGLLLSFLILWLTIDVLGIDHWVAYAIQTVLVIEYNFLLNRTFTWRDRRKEVSFWASWGKFHGVRMLVTIPLNQLLFASLTSIAGLHYLLANTICIATTTAITYVLSDRFIFRGKAPRENSVTPLRYYDGVMATFVIPVKNNDDTIVETVDKILELDWDGEIEVIVVGNHNDTSWAALEDYITLGLVRAFEVNVEHVPGRRDANVKRNYGLKMAYGEILGVIDSDVSLPKSWLRTVATHFNGGHSAVGGAVYGMDNDEFWSRYIDKNPIATKTPRMRGVSILTKQNVGRSKPPVTANFACTRKLYEKVRGPNISFRNSYEDYEWFSRMLRAGFSIVRDEELSAVRYHRQGLRPLLREYTRSGKGCADHIVTHPKCGFALARVTQLAAIGIGAVAFVIGCIIVPLQMLLGVVIGFIAVSTFCALRVRRLEGLVYIALSTLFTGAFIYGVFSRFVGSGFRRPKRPRVSEFRLVEVKA